MARRVQVLLEDDLKGGPADETVRFALDEVAYEIDLSSENANELRDLLRPYVEKARRAGRARARRSAGRNGKHKVAEIRAWAQEEGIPVSARGRVSSHVVAQYEAAHS